MADEIKKVKIKDLPQTTSINDDDIFVESDSLETYKVTADDIAKYVSTNENLTGKYIAKTAIGATNGVAPLNSNKKINGTYITYGTTSNTAYEGSSGKILETNLDNHLTDEDAHGYNTRINNEITRAKNAENSLSTNKLDKTTVAKTNELGLVKSGTDITVDGSGNVSVNDNSHKHTVSNISDLTATASELNVLDGITATTTELNYVDGVTSNIQTQLNAKAPLASPTLTGTPKAPTASAGTNTTQIATTAFVQTAVSNHNSSTTSHTDIRDLITGLTTRLNTLADSDDTTLDQLSEIVAYIKSNRTLIENITTNKVNVADIVDNLTSTATNKPLSAKQGKVLNDLISTLTNTVNTKVDKISGKGLSTNDLTDALKTNYDTAYTHSQSTHARTDATKVEKSSTNGNIKINGTETTVYTHPSGTNPHGTTKSDVGLGNVGNFKAVSTVANQGLTDTEKSNARTNIGAGTSSFSGSYNDLTNKPTIPSGAAANKGVDTSISDASTSTNLPTSKAVASFVEGKGYKTTDNNTTYSLSKSGSTITLTGSDGSKTSVTDSSGSGGSSVSFTQNLTSGTKVGSITIDGTSTDLYAPTDTNTTYSAGTGLSLSGTTFNHKNSVTAGTAQGDANKTLSFGGTFTIPTVSYDAQGHITSKGTTTMTMPANPNSDTKVTQTVTTSDASYPLLLAPSGQTSTATTTSYFDSGVTLNPSTNTIVANVSGSSSSCTGNAATATALGSSAGSATQPVYFSSGKPVACTYTLGKSVPSNAVFTDNDTKNTAGSTDTSSKIFLIGATSQAANPQTYSQDTVYVGTDGCLYSNSARVVSEVVSSTEPTNQKNGDYWLQDY